MMPSVLVLVLVVELVARVVNAIGAKAINDFVRLLRRGTPVLLCPQRCAD